MWLYVAMEEDAMSFGFGGLGIRGGRCTGSWSTRFGSSRSGLVGEAWE